MYFVEGYVSAPDLLDRIWRESVSELQEGERTHEAAYELTKDKLASFLLSCPWAAILDPKTSRELRVGEHFLAAFYDDPFSHRQFQPLNGRVGAYHPAPSIETTVRFIRGIAPSAFVAGLLVALTFIFGKLTYNFITIGELTAAERQLSELPIRILTNVFPMTLSIAALSMLLTWGRSFKQAGLYKKEPFDGWYVMFSTEVVEDTLQRLSEEGPNMLMDKDFDDRFLYGDSPNKGGRPATKRKKMARAYSLLFPNGHGETPQLVVLRQVNQRAGTDGSLHTLKRAIADAQSAEEGRMNGNE